MFQLVNEDVRRFSDTKIAAGACARLQWKQKVSQKRAYLRKNIVKARSHLVSLQYRISKSVDLRYVLAESSKRFHKQMKYIIRTHKGCLYYSPIAPQRG